MQRSSVNLDAKLALISDIWTPKVIAELNDYQIKLVKVQGDFVWHQHDDTDELFLCVSGELKIEIDLNDLAELKLRVGLDESTALGQILGVLLLKRIARFKAQRKPTRLSQRRLALCLFH